MITNQKSLFLSPFNLTAAMFQETEKEKYSSVVVLVKDDNRFTRFENLRSSRACMPEFGGIGEFKLFYKFFKCLKIILNFILFVSSY